MKNINGLLTALSIDESNVSGDEIRQIVESLESKVKNLVTGEFYLSELIDIIEVLTTIYTMYSQIQPDEVENAVQTVWAILDEDYGIVDKLDELIPAHKVPFVGSIIEAVDDSVLRYVVTRVIIPLTVNQVQRLFKDGGRK